MTTNQRLVSLLRVFAFALALGALFPWTSLAQWVRQSSGTAVVLRDVAAIDSLTMVAVGDSGIILKTTDGGIVWSRRPSGTTKPIRALAISPFDHRFIVAVGLNQRLRTTDGGDVWSLDSLAENYLAVACSPDSVPTIWMGSDYGNILFSTDGGGTWSSDYAWKMIIGIALLRSAGASLEVRIATIRWSYVAMISDTSIWTSYSYPVNGAIWEVVTGGDLRGDVQYLVGEGGGGPGGLPFILRRGGGFGENWVRATIRTVVPSFPADAASIPGTHVVYVSGRLYSVSGQEGAIFKSTDDGSTWSVQQSGVTEALPAISFVDEYIGVAVGEGGVILTTRNGGETPQGVDRDVLRPVRMELEQNYPNPFNASTKIQLTIVDRLLTIVNVFDVLGRDVATLVNEVKEPGTYTVEFNGSNLASGVYFYRLNAGPYVECRKMVLMK